MAITVHVSASADPSGAADRASFEGEGEYWCLNDAFLRIRDRTGQYIAVADEAVFSGSALEAVASELKAERAALNSAPRTLYVVVSKAPTRVGRRPTLREVRDSVDREAVRKLLAQLISLAIEARRSGQYLIFNGD